MEQREPIVSNADKAALWKTFRAGSPCRAPVEIATTPRIWLLNGRLNEEGISFERYFTDPATMLKVQLAYGLHRAQVINRYCDDPAGLPERWTVSVDRQNVFEAAFFGAPVCYREGQVPDTQPPLVGANREAFAKVDVTRPLSRGFFSEALALYERLVELAERTTFLDRPVDVTPYFPAVTDGPLTVGMNLRGPELLTDLVLDPDYTDRLFEAITEAAIARAQAFRAYWGKPQEGGGLADDSIQLISTAMYRERVLPFHRRYLEAVRPGVRRSIHLCGDATRHFRTIRDELNVWEFDTGFPVNFAALRRELGPEVLIHGGVEVALLLHGTPEQVYRRATAILTSGIREGGRFILREANNLPPCVPEENLAAMYQAALDQG
ncbi:MAG: uroporphyrinogen decarboxylase family protein [Anaerolineae bacterium]